MISSTFCAALPDAKRHSCNVFGFFGPGLSRNRAACFSSNSTAKSRSPRVSAAFDLSSGDARLPSIFRVKFQTSEHARNVFFGRRVLGFQNLVGAEIVRGETYTHGRQGRQCLLSLHGCKPMRRQACSAASLFGGKHVGRQAWPPCGRIIGPLYLVPLP